MRRTIQHLLGYAAGIGLGLFCMAIGYNIAVAVHYDAIHYSKRIFDRIAVESDQ